MNAQTARQHRRFGDILDLLLPRFNPRSLLLREPTVTQTVIASAFLLGILLALVPKSQLQRPWLVDEGQRIAEGYFWRLAIAGDFTNADWFRDIAVRSHPPVSKYFFGAAVSLAGVPPPHNLELVDAYDRGATGMPPEFAAEYLPRLQPARLASFGCHVLTALILFAVALRTTGPLAAVASQIILFRHYLFATTIFYARSDTLQTLCATSTIVLLLVCVSVSRKPAMLTAATLAGVLSALAFQTRLDGGVVLLMSASFLIAHDYRQPRRVASCLAAMTVAFLVVAVGINPYYWAIPYPAFGVPSIFLTPDPLPSRIVHRYLQQFADLRSLLSFVEPQWHLDSIPQRVAFAASVFFSGKAGIATLVGWLLAVVAMLRRLLTSHERATLAWAFTGVSAITIWIPLSWDFYLLIVLPAGVLGCAVGYGASIRWLLDTSTRLSAKVGSVQAP